MTPSSVLVVDDEAYVRDSLTEVLKSEGMQVKGVGSVADALRVLASEPVHVVLCDLRMPSGDGRGLLHESRRAGLGVPIVMITGAGTIADAVDAMKAGAYDFLQKPVDPDALIHVVKRAAEHFGLLGEVARLRGAAELARRSQVLVGSSPAIERVRALCRQVAASDATVLVSGESGTGKELASVEIHRQSARADRPLLHVNCAVIPDELFESELFGHKKGAFTSAVADRSGWFAEAQGGTLVLDEISALGLSSQAKLLRVLESGEYQRVGESRTQVADVRVIAISNESLADMVKAGAFRSDLYYRIHIFPIEMPPLRQHKEDLAELAEHLLSGFSRMPGRPAHRVGTGRLAPEALEVLSAYEWPGNVRELRNALERAAILVGGAPVGAEVLRTILEPAMAALPSSGSDEFHLRRNLNAAERAILVRAMAQAQNRRKDAAQLLGIDARNMSYYLRKHGLSDTGPKDT